MRDQLDGYVRLMEVHDFLVEQGYQRNSKRRKDNVEQYIRAGRALVTFSKSRGVVKRTEFERIKQAVRP